MAVPLPSRASLCLIYDSMSNALLAPQPMSSLVARSAAASSAFLSLLLQLCSFLILTLLESKMQAVHTCLLVRPGALSTHAGQIPALHSTLLAMLPKDLLDCSACQLRQAPVPAT